MSDDRPMAMVGKKHVALHTPVEDAVIDAETKTLAERMLATLRAGPGGYALAAPQVGVSLNLIVVNAMHGNPPLTWMNVHLEDLSEETETGPEGCLSIPGRHFNVTRSVQCRVFGRCSVPKLASSIGMEAEGIVARMWQHEMDHLKGVLISDQWKEIR